MRVLIIILAMAAGGFLKGVTGAGLPVVAIPALAAFLGVEEAVVLLTLPGVVSNSWLMWQHRGERRTNPDLPSLLVTGCIGVAVGAWLLRTLDDRVLALILAAFIGLYLVRLATNPRFRLSRGVARAAAAPVGIAAGILQGATGISGPILVTFLHSYRMPPPAYVFSVATSLQVFAVAQIVFLTAFGLFTARRLALSALAVVPVMIVLPMGARLSSRLSRTGFDVVIAAVLLASAVRLLLQGLSG